MKYIYIISALLLFTGCVKRSEVEFEGYTPGIKNGVFLIKTLGDSAIFGENIKDGRFKISRRLLKYPGYYQMSITNNDSTAAHPPFEVYLEDGKYLIETERGGLYKYPKISSPSKIQEQLSAYYHLSDEMINDLIDKAKHLKADIKNKGSRLSTAAYNALLNKTAETDIKLSDMGLTILSRYEEKYPKNEVSAHLMAKLNFEDDPAAYYKLFSTFSNQSKNSDDGKELSEKLKKLIKLVKGAKAPVIYGKTAEGKTFDEKSMKNKVILVDFWRASNEISRQNHQTMIDVLNSINDPEKLGIVSVSIDSKMDWWITAIHEDRMTWPQVSDLKGDDTPNAVNWDITKIPTYYLLDGHWNIISRDVNIDQLDFEVTDYLKHH